MLAGCGGDNNSTDSVSKEPVHCSTATKITAKVYKILVSYKLEENSCNDLLEVHITDDDFYAVHGFRVYRSFYKVTGYERLQTQYSADKYTTYVTKNPDSNESESHDIEYSFIYGNDFITKLNLYTTNTDIIYSTSEEYQLISDYSLPEFVLADFEEATQDMDSSNMVYQ